MHNDTVSILKQAILLERRGQAFYAQVARKTESPAVKEFFEMMAAEEDQHEKILSEQYKAFQNRGKFIPTTFPEDETEKTASRILTADLRDKIAAAGFEAAAISAAMSMEERSIRIYSEQAKLTDDLQEKAVYEWLVGWESRHLDLLSRLDRELTEAIWNDNSFWP
ncbi:MAG: ferritin family protein, partial [Deltaproteobacteria bacterium]|nr:ferritin family protein [Deltaproteobacteria bacterium]